MAYRFKPCVSRTACTEDGTHCRACGRSHEEINELRSLVNRVTEFAAKMEYDNSDEFLDYLKSKVVKKLKSIQQAG
jgi:predicted Fe-S protein YdhL (DUF1289 family)